MVEADPIALISDEEPNYDEYDAEVRLIVELDRVRKRPFWRDIWTICDMMHAKVDLCYSPVSIFGGDNDCS